jgi:hypothetical protein
LNVLAPHLENKLSLVHNIAGERMCQVWNSEWGTEMQVLNGPTASMSQQVLSLAGNGQILVDFQSLDNSFTVPEYDGACLSLMPAQREIGSMLLWYCTNLILEFFLFVNEAPK